MRAREDVAVGAPQEDDLKGAVYIYNGGRHGISQTPSQVHTCTHIPGPHKSGHAHNNKQADATRTHTLKTAQTFLSPK